MIAFYHKKYQYVKAWLHSTNLANICVHKSADAKFYPLKEAVVDLLEIVGGDNVCGPSIVFTRETVDGETFIWKWTNVCKSFVGIDTNQLHPYLMCQPMPTGPSASCNVGSEAISFTLR